MSEKLCISFAVSIVLEQELFPHIPANVDVGHSQFNLVRETSPNRWIKKVRVISRANDDHVIRQRVEALQHSVHYTLKLPQFVAIIPYFRNGIHFIKKKHSLTLGNEVEDAADVFGCLAKARRN